MRRVLRVGTRGSKLALAQTRWVVSKLKERFPDLTVEEVVIKTKGDKILDVPLAKIGGKGLFVKEIEEALLRGEVDFAVHSMKDVPSVIPEGLRISVIPERESPWDVFVGRSVKRLDLLPRGARVGTSSLRRRAQLKRARPDLEVVTLRGNVDTRLRKLDEGLYDGIILAQAGLRRLGVEVEGEVLSEEVMLPAVGQGVLAVETREDDGQTLELLSFLHHEPTAVCVKAERAFLRRLEGGCQVPLAAYAVLKDSTLHIRGFVADVDGRRFFKDSVEGPPEKAEELGVRLAESLLEAGADEVLRELLG